MCPVSFATEDATRLGADVVAARGHFIAAAKWSSSVPFIHPSTSLPIALSTHTPTPLSLATMANPAQVSSDADQTHLEKEVRTSTRVGQSCERQPPSVHARAAPRATDGPRRRGCAHPRTRTHPAPVASHWRARPHLHPARTRADKHTPQLAFYGSYHSNVVNKLIHFCFIPQIWW